MVSQRREVDPFPSLQGVSAATKGLVFSYPESLIVSDLSGQGEWSLMSCHFMTPRRTSFHMTRGSPP